MIQNPILPGFNPDPSVLRVGEDFYIATSTFEWFPGVQIHHSRDLINWRLLTHPLDRLELLNMVGNSNSGGIWAPCLTHDGKKFYLIYTDVKGWGLGEPFKDTHNYLVTAEDIMGPWSVPIYLNSSGFDPSLFHDDDGKKWFLNMLWDHRRGKNAFAGILLQEFSLEEKKLKGEIKNIFLGTSLAITEGPHVYKRGGWYYLLTAEGGTTYQHAVTMARSRSLEGPYEVDPTNPILTSNGRPNLPLQKAGHASLVETQNGEWYMVHLVGRPIDGPDNPLRRCTLGRETAIQKMKWTNDEWLRTAHGENHPLLIVKDAALEQHPFEAEPEVDHFDAHKLNINLQSLRVPTDPSWMSLSERAGFLRLYGRESLISKHQQSLVARRLQHFYADISTCVEFEPSSFQQMAGLVAYYDTKHWVYLRISRDEQIGKSLTVQVYDNGKYDEPLEKEISVEGWNRVHLKLCYQKESFGFQYSSDGKNWTEIALKFDAGKLSDDYCNGLGFTGTFIGIAAQDLSGRKLHADFDYFSYVQKES